MEYIRSIFCLALLLTSFQSFSFGYQWVESQVTKLPQEQGSLIRSYQDKEQGYIYDQALAIIAFTYGVLETGSSEKEYLKINLAQSLLKGMESLQNDDGSWYFSYFTDATGPHPDEGDMRPNGAIAWVVLAALHYQLHTQLVSFEPMWKKSINYLEEQLVSINGDEDILAIPFSKFDNSKTPWDERHIAPLEHALDTLAVFELAYLLTKNKKYQAYAQKLKRFVWMLWDEEQGHFWSGYNMKTNEINKDTFYLDNQSWTALAIGDGKNEKIKRALKVACKKLLVKHDDIIGFSESRPARAPASTQDFVWSEGTAFTALAIIQSNTKCENFDLFNTDDTVEKMLTDEGGVRYISKKGVKNFSFEASVAGSVWAWFYRHNVNPFKRI